MATLELKVTKEAYDLIKKHYAISKKTEFVVPKDHEKIQVGDTVIVQEVLQQRRLSGRKITAKVTDINTEEKGLPAGMFIIGVEFL